MRPSTHLPFHRVWGPISQEASTSVGAEFATSSVLIEPLFEAEVVDAAIATVPVDVLPLPCDTKETLTARIAASSFLEDSHVLKGGSGPQRVRLNATSYPQPRRRSWSVIVDQDDEQITLLNYTAYGRLGALPVPHSSAASPRPAASSVGPALAIGRPSARQQPS